MTPIKSCGLAHIHPDRIVSSNNMVMELNVDVHRLWHSGEYVSKSYNIRIPQPIFRHILEGKVMRINPLRSFAFILSKNVGTTVISLAVTPIIVRLLGSSGYGDYAFILSITNVSMLFVNAGMEDGVRKFVAEDRDLPGWADMVFGFYMRVGALLAGVGVLVIVGLNISGVTQRVLDPRFVTYLYLVAILLFARQFQVLFRNALMAKGLEHLSEPLKLVQNLTFSAAAITLAYIGYAVSGVLVGHIFASLSVIILGGYFISQNYDIRLVFKPSRSDLPRGSLLTFNGYNMILVLLMFSLYHIDVLLLNPMVGSAATGYYKAALVISGFLWFVPISIQKALLHSSSEMWANRDASAVSAISARITRYTMVFTTLFILGIAALANPFMPLYFGSNFTASIEPLLLLLPGALGFAVARPIIAIGQGKGNLKPLILATGAAAVINLILNVLLIPKFGVGGAAVSTSIGYGSMVLFHGLAARRNGFRPLSDLRLVRFCVSITISAMFIFGLATFTGPNLHSLLLVPPVGFAVYTATIIKTKTISAEELLDILDNGPDQYMRYPKKIVHLIG